MSILVFHESPVIQIASVTFTNVPTILQYEDTPLIQVTQSEAAGYDIQIPIYHPDGTYLAKVKGSRLVTTEAGRKAGVSLEHPALMDVCKIGDRVVFEIRREEAAALKTIAELHTPEGAFVKCSNEALSCALGARGTQLLLGNTVFIGSVEDAKVGIHLRRDGYGIGKGGGTVKIEYMAPPARYQPIA